MHFLVTGTGEQAAAASVVAQDPGALRHHGDRGDLGDAIFGRYLFAPAFFWEDAVSMVVLALHTAYLWALLAVRWTLSG